MNELMNLETAHCFPFVFWFQIAKTQIYWSLSVAAIYAISASVLILLALLSFPIYICRLLAYQCQDLSSFIQRLCGEVFVLCQSLAVISFSQRGPQSGILGRIGIFIGSREDDKESHDSHLCGGSAAALLLLCWCLRSRIPDVQGPQAAHQCSNQGPDEPNDPGGEDRADGPDRPQRRIRWGHEEVLHR